MQRISYILFLFLLLFCPLAFGTVETWSLTILETGTAVSFLLLGCSLLLGKTKTPGLKVPGILPLFLLLGFMILQLLPLPISLVKLLSPATFEIYRPLLDLDPSQKFIPLTVHRKSSLLLLFTFSAYALIYLLTVYHCQKIEKLKQTVTIVTALGIFIATLAIVQKLTSPEAIYWFRVTPNSSPVGPWVYSNHFAGFMGMLFPLTVALFLYYRPRLIYDTTIRKRFISVMTMPGANRYLLLGTGAMLMAVSILFSISRGGIITLGFAFLFFIFFSTRISTDARTRWAVVLTILVVMMISWLGWQPIVDKFGNLWGDTGLNTSGRLPVLLDSLKLFRAYPLFGSGFGTFIHMYPGVRTVPGEAVFDHAHNDYIELLANGGIIGFMLCVWFVLAVLTHSVKTLIRRRDRYAILVGSGSLTGLLALLFHSLADFQMYNGANGLYFFFFCGLAVSAASTRMHYQTRHTLLEEKQYTVLVWPVIFAFILLITCSWYKLSASRAEKITAPLRSIYLNKHIPPEKFSMMHATLSRSARLDLIDAEYPFILGNFLSFQGNRKQAQQEYLRACLIQPTSGQYLQQLGLSLNKEHETQKKNLLALGLQRNPLSLPEYLTYSNWLLHNNQRNEAFIILNQAMNRIPRKISTVIDYMLPLRFSTSEIEKMLSENPAAWYEVGRRMEKEGRFDKAELYYRRSIEIAGEDAATPNPFNQLYNLYKRQKKMEMALKTLRMGIKYLPEYAQFRVQMGDYYLRQEIPYRAQEEYMQALRLDPKNRAVLLKLEKMKQL